MLGYYLLDLLLLIHLRKTFPFSIYKVEFEKGKWVESESAAF